MTYPDRCGLCNGTLERRTFYRVMPSQQVCTLCGQIHVSESANGRSRRRVAAGLRASKDLLSAPVCEAV